MNHNGLFRPIISLVIVIFLTIPIASTATVDVATYNPDTGVLHLPALDWPNDSGKVDVIQADLRLIADSPDIVFELIAQQESAHPSGQADNASYDLNTNTVKVPVVEIRRDNGVQLYTGEMQINEAEQFIVTEVSEIDSALLASLPKAPNETDDSIVEGIDSDNDEVRDDVQRYIALNYSTSEEAPVRAVLTNYAMQQQQFLLDADDPEKTLANARKRNKYVDCLLYLRPEDGVNIVQNFETVYINTEQRVEVYAKADKHLAGQTFSLTPRSELAATCGKPAKSRTRSPNDGSEQQLEPLCSSTYIAFVNGVRNTQDSAYAALRELEITLQGKILANINPKYILVYNPTEGAIGDLWETITQKFFRIDSNDIGRHVVLYEDWLARNKRVIVISHSQGNLHANQSYDRLVQANIDNLDSNFRIVSLANPDQRVAGQCYRSGCSSAHYTTIKGDGVVGDGILPGMPSNIENDWYCSKSGECSEENRMYAPKFDYGENKGKEDKKHHNFIGSYLRGNNTQQWLIDRVNTAIDETQHQNSCPSIYGVHDEGLNDSQFFTVDSETYEVQKLGQLHENVNIEGLDINTYGELYAVSSDSDTPEPQDDKTQNPGYLYKVDPNTGEIQSIGNTGFTDIDSITFDSAGYLWGWSKEAGAVEIDVTTGKATLYPDAPNIQDVEDVSVSWGDDTFYLVQKSKLLVYGNEEPICHFGGKTEGLEIVFSQDDNGYYQDSGLIGIHGQPFIRAFNFADDWSCENKQDIPVKAEDLGAKSSVDIEGITWIGEILPD